MSEKHQMPGYRPSTLGAATKVRIAEPGMEISAYSVVTIIVLFVESLAKKHAPVNSSLYSVAVIRPSQESRFAPTSERFPWVGSRLS
jgi:hypothetical protein